MKSTKALAYLIAFILPLATFFVLRETEEFSIVPLPNNVAFDVYHEGDTLQHSIASADTVNNIITFQYELNSAKLEPFAAIFFYQNDSNLSFFNLKKYDQVCLKIKGKKAKRIPITFTQNYSGFTSWEKELSNLPYTALLELDDDQQEYVLPFSDFEIPSWWLRLHQLKKEDLNQEDWSRVNYFVIGSCQLLGGDVADQIEIKEVTFGKSNRKLGLSMAFLFVGILLFFVMDIVSSKRKKLLIPVSETELQRKRSTSDELAIVLEYIGNHYANDQLSQEEIDQATGIKARKIGELLKQELGINFKNYLNFVRLSEVKRLLVESELNVSEIAYQTGYSNISHFNRVFKAAENCSPKEYRELHKKL